jgi:hypothetical protein
MLLLLGALGVSTTLPSGAAADPQAPVPFANSYASTSATTGVLYGTVNPEDDQTTYDAVWDDETSNWCQSGGTMGSPNPANVASVSSDSLPAGTDAVNVTVEIPGLVAGTQYCAALEAVNPEGDVISTPVPAFYQDQPGATSGTYVSNSASTGTLSGTVNPDGDSSTGYQGVYGTADSDFCKSAGDAGSPTLVPGGLTMLNSAASAPLPASVTLQNLTQDASYCVAIEAISNSGTTISTPVNFTQGAPVPVAASYTSTSSSGGLVIGTVDPNGDSTTTYQALYGTSGSTFCKDGGSGGSPMGSGFVSLASTSNSPVSVEIPVTGLSGQSAYCAAIEATGDSGNADVTSATIPLTQDEPAATTSSYRSTSSTGGTLTGTVNPYGDATTYQALYAPSSSSWCNSDTAQGSATGSATASIGSPAGSSNLPETIQLSGLSADGKYCVGIEATSAAGTSISPLITFTQGAPVPVAVSYTSTSATGGEFTGTVDPNGDLSTQYQALYAPVASSFCTANGTSVQPTATGYVTLDATDAASNSAVSVTVAVSGLTNQAGYCIALESSGANGTVSATSTTVAFTQSQPAATATSYQSTSATGGVLSGTVNADGDSSVQEQAVYALASSNWCTSAGTQGAPTGNTGYAALGSSPTTSAPVTLTGLQAGSKYCAAIEASGNSGSSISTPVSFTQGVPSATTAGFTEIDPTHTTITGSVNASGQATTYYVDYDTSGSAFCSGGGGTIAATDTTSPVAATGITPTNVTVSLSNAIVAEGSYCAQIVANNGAGTTYGALVTFTQGIPAAVTGDAYSTGAATAVVDGTVNPDGQSTSYYVVYDTVGSAFCAGNGSDATTFVDNAAPSSLSDTGTNPDSVSFTVSGLTGGTNYCIDLVASNSYGQSAITDPGTITLDQGVPLTQISSVTDNGPDTAQVSASVDPVNQSPTSYQVLYDVQGSTFCKGGGGDSTTQQSGWQTFQDGGSAYVTLTIYLDDLSPNQPYCAGIEAANNSGYSQYPKTGLVTFTAGDPFAYIQDVESLTPSSVEVDGEVNSSGQTTSYQVGYDTQASMFCSGLTNTPGHLTTPVQPLGNTNITPTSISVDVTGLQPGVNYCASVIATNPSGEAPIRQVDFTAGVPAVSTTDAFNVQGNVATVQGTVDPAGQSTSYYIGYGPASSDFCQGNTLTPTYTSAVGTVAGTTDSYVTLTLTGLSINTPYCAIVIATNASGVSPYDPPSQSVAFTTDSTIVNTNTGSGSSGSSGSGGSSGGSSSGSGGSTAPAPVSTPAAVTPTVTPTVKAGITSAKVDSALNGIALPSGKLRTVAGILAKSVTEKFTAPGAGTLRIVWTVKYRKKTYTIASSTATFSTLGKHQLTIKLNATGRKLLKEMKRLVAVTDVERFAPKSGAVGTTTKHFTLK